MSSFCMCVSTWTNIVSMNCKFRFYYQHYLRSIKWNFRLSYVYLTTRLNSLWSVLFRYTPPPIYELLKYSKKGAVYRMPPGTSFHSGKGSPFHRPTTTMDDMIWNYMWYVICVIGHWMEGCIRTLVCMSNGARMWQPVMCANKTLLCVLSVSYTKSRSSKKRQINQMPRCQEADHRLPHEKVCRLCGRALLCNGERPHEATVHQAEPSREQLCWNFKLH